MAHVQLMVVTSPAHVQETSRERDAKPASTVRVWTVIMVIVWLWQGANPSYVSAILDTLTSSVTNLSQLIQSLGLQPLMSS